MQEEFRFLEEQQVDSRLLEKVKAFRKEYPVTEAGKDRVVCPSIPFFGKDILEILIRRLQPSAQRCQGDRQEYPGREPGVDFWQAGLQYFF